MAEWLIAPVLKTGIVLKTIEGSNPSLSFCSLKRFFPFYFARPGKIKEREWLGWGKLAEPEKNDKFFEVCYLYVI